MSGREKEAFLAAFGEALRPLIKIARRYGVDGHELRDSFMQASTEFAAEQINKREGVAATPARVAVQVGLTQGEVRARLLRSAEGSNAYDRRVQAMSAILNAWHTDSAYAALLYEIARDIPFEAPTGKASFSALCDSYAPGESAELLLEDLVEAGAVARLEGNFLRPLGRALVLPPGELSRLQRMGKAYQNFGEAFFQILASDEPGHFRYVERIMVSDYALDQNGARALNVEIRERGTKFLTDLDTWLTGQRRRLESENGKRYGCGIYFFEDVASAESTPLLLGAEDEESAGARSLAGKAPTVQPGFDETKS